MSYKTGTVNQLVVKRQKFTDDVDFMYGKEKNNIFALDGLRGVASLCVILSHSFLMFIPGMHTGSDFTSGWQEDVFNSPFSFFYKGNAAVSIFFVLSGIVLSLSCLRNNDISYIRKAALKRYIRLGLPVGVSVIICYIMMVIGVFSAGKYGLLNIPLASAFQFEPDFLAALWDSIFGAMIFGNVRYNYVLWTISVELFGSFLVYAIVALFGGCINILRAVSLIGAVYLMTRDNIYSAFYGLFVAGVFISTFKIRFSGGISSKLTAIASLFLGLYLAGYAPNSSSYIWLVNELWSAEVEFNLKIQWPVFVVSIGAIFIVATIFIDYSILSFLSKGFFRYIGKLSYSIYLLHPLVLGVIGPLVYVFIAKYSYGAVLTFAITTFITFLASIPFYIYVDKKAIELASNLVSAKIS